MHVNVLLPGTRNELATPERLTACMSLLTPLSLLGEYHEQDQQGEGLGVDMVSLVAQWLAGRVAFIAERFAGVLSFDILVPECSMQCVCDCFE